MAWLGATIAHIYHMPYSRGIGRAGSPTAEATQTYKEHIMSADFAAVAEAVVAKATEETQTLHDLAKQIKAKSGNADAVKAFLESSTDEEIIKEREYIAAAVAKIAERKKKLEEVAKAALVPDDFDPEAKTKEFKELRVKVRTLLMQSKGTLAAFNQDTSELDEALDNLPNITGGISASGKSPAELAAIRTWANDNGYEVAERGRIKAEIVAAYDAAKNAEA